MKYAHLSETIVKISESLNNLTYSESYTLNSASPLLRNNDSEISQLISLMTQSLSQEDQRRVANEYFRSGPIEELLENTNITEIIVNGPDSVWIEERGQLHQVNDRFLSPLTYRNFMFRLCREAEMQVNIDCPFADGHWKQFRVHVAIPPATKEAAVITFRRHPQTPWTFDALQENKWADGSEIQLLRRMIKERKNFLIAGGTGSGKTSVLNACLQELKPTERTVIIEDTSELIGSNRITTKLLTRRDPNRALKEIDQSELVKQTLRMRPDRIVMGEIRGGEAKDLLMAFATGHAGCMGTLHADSARQALIRLEMLIQMGAESWNLNAIRNLIHMSINAIVVVSRTESGQRKLNGIYKIASLEDVGFLLEKLK